MTEDGDMGRCLVGSANATVAAWLGTNWEAMVDMGNAGISIDNFLQNFVLLSETAQAKAAREKDGYPAPCNPWLERWALKDHEYCGPEPETDHEARCGQCFESLANLKFTVRLEPENRLNFEVQTNTQQTVASVLEAHLPSDYTLKWCPLTLANGTTALKPLTPSNITGQWAVSLPEVTDLIYLSLEAEPGSEGMSFNRIFKANETFGIDKAARDNAVYRQWLEGVDFTALLRQMLVGGLLSDAMPVAKTKSTSSRGNAGGAAVFRGIALEELMVSCIDDPEQVTRIQDLMELFEPERIDEDFKAVWANLRAAYGPKSEAS